MNQQCVLSVLIVSYNRRDDLAGCLDSLLPQTVKTHAEVLVLDNGSSDGTQEMIEGSYLWVKLLRWDYNRGLAPALRHLISQANGEWLFFLDSDTELQPGCIDTLLGFVRSNESIGAAAPKLRDLEGMMQMTARSFPGPMNALFGRQTFLSKIWPTNPITAAYLRRDALDDGRPFRCDWVAFAAALIRRKALEEAGSIDETFYVYWVDADFFKRMKLVGWEVWCYPSAEVLHKEHHRSGRRTSSAAIRDFHRGALRYFYKHHGWYGANPLLWCAALALSLRALMLLAVNRWRTSG